MASPSVTYTFSNSTTADATQVNTNFTDIINGVSDGTKDLSINALTCAGSATFNGSVTLGNASGDDVTVTGSLASSIAVKTHATYNVGGATTGLLSVYISGTSTFTTRIISAATATWTLSLPPTAGVINDVPLNGGSGVTTWEPRSSRVVLAKTTTYTALVTDEVITVDGTGGAFTVTLPAASTASKKVLRLIRIDNTPANQITIDGNASETINGALTRTLCTRWESVEIICDGSNWHVLSHNYPMGWQSATITGTWTSNTTYTAFERRSGDSAEYMVTVATSAAPTSASLLLTIPRTIDTAKMSEASAAYTSLLGSGRAVDSSTNAYTVDVAYESTTQVRIATPYTVLDQLASVTQAAPFTFLAGDSITVHFRVPISGWVG